MSPRRRRTSSAFTAALADISYSAASLRRLAGSQSTVFEQQSVLRLSNMSRQLDELRQLTLSFDATETWRTVYHQILQSCQTRKYLSVALIRSDAYWRDGPGESSLEFNFRLVEHGFIVRRTFIIDPFFWPPAAKTPAREVMQWITAQHDRGIITSLVRLSDLDKEPDLVCDVGIYGDDAVGVQETDFEGKTVRFQIHFDPQQIQETEERWNRIDLYAIPLEDLTT